MSEWKEVKLGEAIEIKHGYAFKGSLITTEKTKNILVTPGNFNIGGGFKGSKYKYYNSEDFDKSYILKAGDIVVTMTDLSKESDTLGYSAKIPVSQNCKFLHNQRIGLVLWKNNSIDKEFIYWLMRTKEYQSFIVGSASGTSIMHTSPSRIKEYLFICPKPPEQKAIASVLSSLDDKIDLLHRQNETLEKIAETLFRQWFVEEAKDDWEEVKLGEEFDFTMGASPPGDSYNEEKNGTPMFQGNADFGFRFPKNRVFTINPKRFAEKFDTLISVRAPVGAQNMAIEKCCIGRGVAAFRYKKNKLFYSYTYYKLKYLLDEIKQFNETGTVFGSISKSDFDMINTILPPSNMVDYFQQRIKPADEKIYNNTKQIQTLTNLRDTLLPKLMSGEVRVGN